MRKLTTYKGFSLLEVLITLALFLIFFVAIQQVFPLHKRVIVRSENTAIATSLAQERMEYWVKRGYDDVVLNYDPSPHSGVFPNPIETGPYDTNPNSQNYKFTKQVTFTYLDPNNLPNPPVPSNTFTSVIKVTITISFTQNGQTNSVSLVNYLTSKNRPS